MDRSRRRQRWTYDRIGNRLTETRGAATDTYSYPANAAGGRNPKLQSVAPPTGESRKYGYDAAGNNILIFDRDTRLDLLYDSANRLSTLRSVAEDTRTNLLYDGRGFLRQASAGVDECRPGVTIPTYDSQGLLHRRAHLSLFAPAAPPSDTDTVFYFAGRPVATLRLYSTGSTLTYLTADHLGTPILATADTGSLIWQGGFEPFGANWNGASGAGVFLRFPGQWVDQEWEGGRLESGLFYNVWRWYQPAMGRYERVDPIWNPRYLSEVNPYAYALKNPILFIDPLGLVVERCCRPSHLPLLGGAVLHCWVKTSAWQAGQQQDPNDPSRCPFFNTTVIADHSAEKGADVRCHPATDVDENCVDDFISKNMGAKLGSFPQQTCHDFVNNLFRRCAYQRCGPPKPFSMQIPPAAGWSFQ